MNEPKRNWLLLIAAALTLVIVFVGVTMDDADASDYQPYGGCVEAIDYPHSEGAQVCRDHGWTVTRRIVVRPDKVVLGYQHLPVCVTEDSTATPCRWNFGAGQPHGNGRGRAFWVNSHGVRHFVRAD